METTLKLGYGKIDFKNLDDSDSLHMIEICIYSDIHDLLVNNKRKEKMDRTETIFSLKIDVGGKTLDISLPIDELELFASSVLKQIEIIQKLYGEDIKMQNRL